jgi:membrane-bound ClpP family serine protease
LTDETPQKKENVIDKLFLFGIRPFMIVMALLIGGLYFLISGALSSDISSLFTGVILVLLGTGLAYGFKTTGTKRITKKYYNKDTKVGRQGKAKSAFGPGEKGVVDVDNELWTAVSDDYLRAGDEITVISVESDNVTLRVGKRK